MANRQSHPSSAAPLVWSWNLQAQSVEAACTTATLAKEEMPIRSPVTNLSKVRSPSTSGRQWERDQISASPSMGVHLCHIQPQAICQFMQNRQVFSKEHPEHLTPKKCSSSQYLLHHQFSAARWRSETDSIKMKDRDSKPHLSLCHCSVPFKFYVTQY